MCNIICIHVYIYIWRAMYTAPLRIVVKLYYCTDGTEKIYYFIMYNAAAVTTAAAAAGASDAKHFYCWQQWVPVKRVPSAAGRGG